MVMSGMKIIKDSRVVKFKNNKLNLKSEKETEWGIGAALDIIRGNYNTKLNVLGQALTSLGQVHTFLLSFKSDMDKVTSLDEMIKELDEMYPEMFKAVETKFEIITIINGEPTKTTVTKAQFKKELKAVKKGISSMLKEIVKLKKELVENINK